MLSKRCLARFSSEVHGSTRGCVDFTETWHVPVVTFFLRNSNVCATISSTAVECFHVVFSGYHTATPRRILPCEKHSQQTAPPPHVHSVCRSSPPFPSLFRPGVEGAQRKTWVGVRVIAHKANVYNKKKRILSFSSQLRPNI